MAPLDSRVGGAASIGGRSFNSGEGPMLQVLDIAHPTHMAVVDPDTAFWALIRKEKLGDALSGGTLLEDYASTRQTMAREMEMLRFHLKPSAVYFNPTERCNLDCTYCYIPGDMRSGGRHMTHNEVLSALTRLAGYFEGTMGGDRKPQVIFHGAEPLLNREPVFAAIDIFQDVFRFGVQTNATLLDESAVAFLTSRHVSIGLSLDAPDAATADRTRKTWSGQGVHAKVLRAMERLRGYPAWSVITTITAENVTRLTDMVDFFHAHQVPTCMLNVIRCTLDRARTIRADDATVAEQYVAALERSHRLFEETGRKLVIANFANILISMLAPTARRLMCDISPCGGGRSFFALAPDGGLFPCSEFIGLEEFRGGNLFTDPIEDVLDSPAFRQVTERKVEDIAPCSSCAIRHFCGSPCPAEAHEMNGGMDRVGAYCAFYEEQARYGFRLIADGEAEDFLWDGWDEGTETVFSHGMA